MNAKILLKFLFLSILGSIIFDVDAQNPGGIATSPAVWYNPDGATPTSWIDASGNGLNLSVQSGTVTVKFGDAAHNFNSWTTGYSSSNYYNYIDSTASNKDLEANIIFGNYNVNNYSYTPLTIFGVARATSASNTGEITGIDNENANGAEPALTVNPSGSSLYPRFYRFGNGIDQTATSMPVPIFQTSLYKAQPYPGDNGSNAGNLIMGLNGKDTVIANQNGKSSVAGPYLKIGYSSFGFGAFQGDIQEVVWYKAALNTSDMQKVETYLALKFGTTLAHDYVNPAGTVLYSESPSNRYTSNIAGLARDSVNGNLDQRQSNSINAGVQLLIGTTGLGNNNTTNTVDLNADGQYLIWGDNGKGKNLSVPFSDSTGSVKSNYRFGAVWMVRNIGNVGTVRVAWPAGIQSLKLITNPSDSTFASGNTVKNISSSATTINGVTYNYADVTLTDGSYLTFAGYAYSPGGVESAPALWFRSDIGTNTTSAGTNNLTSWADINNISTATTTVINTAGGATSYPSYDTATSFFNFNPYVDFTTVSQSIGDPNATPLTGADAADQFTVTYNTNYGGYGADNRMFSMNYDPAPATYDVYTYDYMADNATYFFNRTGQIVSTNPTHAYDNYYLTGTTYRTNNLSNIIKHSVSLGATSIGIQANGMTPTTIANNGGATGLLVPQGGYIMGSLGNSYTTGFGNSVGNVFKSAENILFSRNLTSDETQRVNSYLAIRYGITLGGNGADDSSFNYLNSADNIVWTNQKEYHNNVIGIARDDNSLLQQQISTSSSVNPDIVTISTDTNFTSVNGSHAAVKSNKSFLMIGNNQGSISTSTSFTYNSINYNRIVRKWGVQSTNFGQEVFIAVATANLTTALGSAPDAGSSYALITASDSLFTSNVRISWLTEGSTVSYARITPADGKSYFTFAVLSTNLLPVMLSSFTGSRINNANLLNWKTSSEVNNKGFELQRSIDNAQTWKNITFKKGNETSTQTNSYTYSDWEGAAYSPALYRLVQYDLDGDSTVLNQIVSIQGTRNTNVISVYPNPTQDKVTVTGIESGDVLSVFNISGNVIIRITATNLVAAIDLSKSETGVYFLMITRGKHIIQKIKLVKK